MTKFFAASILSILLKLNAFASPQLPDYIIYKGDTLATYTLLLEQYLQIQEKTDQGKLFGLSFREGATLNCWRGYQAIYRVDNDSLFLVDIISCGERRNSTINKAESADKLKSIFNAKVINDRVYIDWFSGDLKFPITNKVLRWDGVFYTIYEKEKVISISKGNILSTQDVENYVDDPKRIDRKDKNKISDIIFKKLKKLKFRNKEDFDCSDKYMVTIDENGDVSKVRMLYSDEEVEEYYERDEYNFCIQKLFGALKSLKFDIIKDKGKPIAEDIYIEIWVEDNWKIENWTR